MKRSIHTVLMSLCFVSSSWATITTITDLPGTGALDTIIGTPAPIPFTLKANMSNDSKLYVWNERQNVTLTSDLSVDRVADTTASYLTGSAGNWKIKAGTIVSSHYVQWDPGRNTRVKARLTFDSDIFAFITADQKLFNSDSQLGLPGINYNNFTNRGLESGDQTVWGTPESNVDIDWTATSPGDWTRLITAYSPRADEQNSTIPAPGAIILGCLGTGFVSSCRRFRHI